MDALSNYAETVNTMEEAMDLALKVRNAIPVGKTGTARRWFEAHNGSMVETVTINVAGRIKWMPGARTVHARGTYATLNASRIDYSPVVRADDNTLILEGFNGDVIIYTDHNLFD